MSEVDVEALKQWVRSELSKIEDQITSLKDGVDHVRKNGPRFDTQRMLKEQEADRKRIASRAKRNSIRPRMSGMLRKGRSSG